MTARRMKSDQVRQSWRDVLERVRSGRPVVVEHYNRPVAQITPVPGFAVTLGEKIRVETPEGTGLVVHDPWKHEDDPWLWEIVDRRTASDESGLPMHGGRYAPQRWTNQWDALGDLVRAMQAMIDEEGSSPIADQPQPDQES